MSGLGSKLERMARQRMTRTQRRDQLLAIGRAAFAERGFDGISMEEIALRADVSKPVVYEHFGSKTGLYDAVVSQEMARFERTIVEVIQNGRWRERIDNGVLALLTYIEEETDGFIILVHGRIFGRERTYSTVLNRVTAEVSYLLERAFEHRGLDASVAALYGQALVGTVSNTALWWLDQRGVDTRLDKATVAAHISNLCWNGLKGLEEQPRIMTNEVEEQ